ncbi:hypothetical protein Vi05172_g6798 [Venturia inaequalis]|nr:hypothetical protein Vi05172_g6798 [Venturia inaequalis]
MLFNTVVFSAIAALAASVQAADSCSAGAIIGIQAVCGSGANDCGSGRCCLADQTCVPSGSSFACADPNLSPGETVTVNAGCYGTAGSTPTSSTSSGKPTSSTKSGSTKPSSASATHTSGALSDSASVNYPVGSASGSGSAPKSTDKVVQSNSATSAFSSPQNSFAILISALAIAAFSL